MFRDFITSCGRVVCRAFGVSKDYITRPTKQPAPALRPFDATNTNNRGTTVAAESDGFSSDEDEEEDDEISSPSRRAQTIVPRARTTAPTRQATTGLCPRWRWRVSSPASAHDERGEERI